MAVEESVYTEQPAMSAVQLREFAAPKGLELRFMDLAGKPLGPAARLDEPMCGKGYVLIGWPVADTETTDAVELALRNGDKPAVDRLGAAGKLGWCSIGCRAFDFAEYQRLLERDLEEEDDEEPVPADVMERMSRVRTQYSFRCGTSPRQCGQLLGKVAELIRVATDGFGDE